MTFLHFKKFLNLLFFITDQSKVRHSASTMNALYCTVHR